MEETKGTKASPISGWRGPIKRIPLHTRGGRIEIFPRTIGSRSHPRPGAKWRDRQWRQFPRSGRKVTALFRTKPAGTIGSGDRVEFARVPVSSASLRCACLPATPLPPCVSRALALSPLRAFPAGVLVTRARCPHDPHRGPPLTDNGPFVTLATSFLIFLPLLPPAALLLCRLRCSPRRPRRPRHATGAAPTPRGARHDALVTARGTYRRDTGSRRWFHRRREADDARRVSHGVSAAIALTTRRLRPGCPGLVTWRARGSCRVPMTAGGRCVTWRVTRRYRRWSTLDRLVPVRFATDDWSSVSPVTSLSLSADSPFFSLEGGGVSILTDGEQRPPAPREWYLPLGLGNRDTCRRYFASRMVREASRAANRWEDVIRSPAYLRREMPSRDPLFGIASNWRQCFSLSYLSLSLFLIVRYLSSVSSVSSSILPVVLTSDSRTRGGSRSSVGVGTASEHRCERSRQHGRTTGRNRWRLIQIRSPRGGDGVVPETAAGTTPGAGQYVAISRPSIQPAVPPWIHLKNPASSASQAWCNPILEISGTGNPHSACTYASGGMRFTIVLLHIRDECLFRAKRPSKLLGAPNANFRDSPYSPK